MEMNRSATDHGLEVGEQRLLGRDTGGSERVNGGSTGLGETVLTMGRKLVMTTTTCIVCDIDIATVNWGGERGEDTGSIID